MKCKSIVIMTIFLVLQLCSSLSALPTTASEAEMVVQGWLKIDPQPLDTAIGQKVREVEIFTNDNDEPLYYVVYLDPSGFVIVSADDSIEPIIGFADDGTYDPSPDNPLGALVTNDLNGRMATSQNSFSLMAVAPQSQLSNTQKKWNYLLGIAEASEGGFRLMGLKRISDVWVAPLIQSKWDQETVCNELCYNYWTPNNYPSGCVATAMAQLMRFYQYPFLPEDSVPNNIFGRQSFKITVNGNNETRYLKGGNGFGGLYKWDLMVLIPDCTTSSTEREAIGALCFDAGISINTDYAADGSSALLYKAKEALLSTFKYENAISGWKYNSLTQTFRDLGSRLKGMINPNLDAGHPVILSLRRTGSDGGHAALADGYGYNFSTLYHHLNMGWSGNHDIYYNLPNVDSDPPYDVIDECIYNIFTSGKGEIISGRVTDEYGNPIRGARVTANRIPLTRPISYYSDETNDKGIYAISGLNSNTMYTLNVDKTGYNFESTVVSTGQSRDGGSFSGNRWGINFKDTDPVIFEDNFSSTFLDTTKWPQSNYQVFVSQNSLYLGADHYFPGRTGSPRQSGFGSVTSKVINLSQYSRATLSFQHRPNAFCSESDLVVKYWNSSAWKEVSRVEVDQLVMADDYDYEKLTIALPSDAFHAEFRLSISRSWVIPEILSIGKSFYINYGDWSVDDVKIIPTY